MLRFKNLDFVKIKTENLKEELPIGTLMVTRIINLEDYTKEYELMDVCDGTKYVGIPDDWLDPAEPPIPAIPELSIKGLTISEETNKVSIQEESKTVSILGTTYTIVEKPLKDCDGYCDKTTKEIAIATKDDDCDFGNFEEHRKKVLRHEIIHAYHHESGLAESFENKQYGFSETVVYWFAIQ